MGDDDVNVIVPAVAPSPPAPSPAELWHAEHEARHSEHMAHLESIREEHRSEVNRLEERIAVCEGLIAAIASQQPQEPVTSAALDEALETVERVGDTIAHVTDAITPEEVVEAPPPSHGPPRNSSAGPEAEVEPDVTTDTGTTTNAPANRRRKVRIW